MAANKERKEKTITAFYHLNLIFHIILKFSNHFYHFGIADFYFFSFCWSLYQLSSDERRDHELNRNFLGKCVTKPLDCILKEKTNNKMNE